LFSDSSLISPGELKYIGYNESYLDYTGDDGGSDINLNYGMPAASALNVRNPSDMQALIINLPTTGFQDILFQYASKRTINGAQLQDIYYSVSENFDWIKKSNLSVSLDTFSLYRFDFSANTSVNNNSNFKIKIVFRGDQSNLEEGNNKFDNISLEGNVYQPGLNQTPLQKNRLSVYPNPNTGEFNIISHTKYSHVTFEIFSAVGLKIDHFAIEQLEPNVPVKISLNHKSMEGIYFIKAFSEDIDLGYVKILVIKP
jgi:hypothetical protein